MEREVRTERERWKIRGFITSSGSPDESLFIEKKLQVNEEKGETQEADITKKKSRRLTLISQTVQVQTREETEKQPVIWLLKHQVLLASQGKSQMSFTAPSLVVWWGLAMTKYQK